MKTFCPNCEKETESTFICEVHCCNECDEDNGNYDKPLTTKHQSEIARLTARVKELEAQLKDEDETAYSAWKCGWCNERFPTPAEAMEHALSCETHPLVQRIKKLEDANRWHKTDGDNLNLMPKKDEDVLFITKQNNIIKGHWEWMDEREEYFKYPAWTDYFDDYDCLNVTHWRPLPDVPVELPQEGE